MLFYVFGFIFNIVQDPSISEAGKTIASFFPQVAVQLASINLLKYEEAGIGVSFSNGNELYLNYRFGTALWMNVISFVVFFFLGLYLENILPSAVGVRKPFYFPFTREYWFESKKAHHEHEENEGVPRGSGKIANSSDVENESGEKHEIDPTAFEDVPEYLRRKEDDDQYMKITNLKKKFEGGFWAVNGLEGVMYEDQIFALLGHNGAGKTTTINMLCGMMSPTSGNAKIYGYDVKTQMKDLRKIMGFCPQHNILFPKLTAKEHLRIFSDFKGMPTNQINDEIDQILIDLNMKDKANVMSKDLSGGYKRKLSLGIALCGGSKVVFLDEPSSGMDVTARREMWDMLKKYKNDRIIILTTHYMEEADNLGDRIGIMSRGQMLCCGDPDFLKNRFGEGYNLVVVKELREENTALEKFVTENIKGAKKVSEVSSEATYLLPKDSSSEFPKFFKEFDDKLKGLNASGYGVSMTTLEEVFLAVEKGDQDEDKKVIEKIKRRMTSNVEENDNFSIAKDQISGGFAIFWLHFIGLIIKRYILSKRNVKGFLLDILVPSLLIIAGFGIATIEFYVNSDQRVLEPSLFPLPQRVNYNAYNTGGNNADTLINLLSPSSSFDPSSVTTSGADTRANLEDFDDKIYQTSTTGVLTPYRYGHYYFESLDYTNHQYQIVTLVNSTSQDAHVAFPHFMYEAILRNKLGASFNYTMINDPMPIVQVYRDQEKGGNSLFLGFVLGIGLALIPTSIIGFILHERVNALVHQQIISGMNKASYWISNFIFDISKTFIPILVAIAFLYIYKLEYDYAWLLLFLFPFAIVPYTYATSFLFDDEGSAQNFTIIHHFFIGGFMPITVFVLRLIRSTRDIGDIVMWIPRIIPSYNTIGGIVIIALKDQIANDRKEKVPDALSFDAAGGDVLFLCLHLVFWSVLLVLIEIGLFNCLRQKGKVVHDEQEELDEDVAEEQTRVEQTSESQLAVKADHLRKVYGSKVAVKDVSFGLDFGD